MTSDDGDTEGTSDRTPLVLGPMLRHVGRDSATIWLETARPGVIEILGHRTTTFSVRGKHFALVVIEGLEPDSMTRYDVRFDGEIVWPLPESELPPSVIRTLGHGRVDLLVGSCRAAAPHEEPYTLELAADERGRGVDALWAHAHRMIGDPPESWPVALLLVGDQIYADDSSPSTQQRIEDTRDPSDDLPATIVADFDEYCWLYHEAWSPTLERWLFSVMPTLMIFDDHDVIDDWNISAAWVAEMQQESWWAAHALGSTMSYWIYQHLGNQSPAQIREEGLLAELVEAGDGTARLESWAEAVRADPAGYRFSYSRHLGEVKVVVIDGRHGRELSGSRRRMVNAAEWAWVQAESSEPVRHLVVATTLPVFIPAGLHDLQVWNERVCDGAWGRFALRFGERVRRALDLEDWSAFEDSYAEFVDLVGSVARGPNAPETVVVASGDIHFSYVARVALGTDRCRVYQLVSSPIRNALIPPERGVLRFTLTGVGSRIGAALRRLTRRSSTAVPIDMVAGPHFDNNMAVVRFRHDGDVEVVIEQATSDDDGPRLDEVSTVPLS